MTWFSSVDMERRKRIDAREGREAKLENEAATPVLSRVSTLLPKATHPLAFLGHVLANKTKKKKKSVKNDQS